MGKDYYKILGIDKNASQDEIRKAFQKMAHQHHPDKQGGNEAKFKEINEAYQVLGNEQKRKQFDQFGADFEQAFGQTRVSQVGPAEFRLNPNCALIGRQV